MFRLEMQRIGWALCCWLGGETAAVSWIDVEMPHCRLDGTFTLSLLALGGSNVGAAARYRDLVILMGARAAGTSRRSVTPSSELQTPLFSAWQGRCKYHRSERNEGANAPVRAMPRELHRIKVTASRLRRSIVWRCKNCSACTEVPFVQSYLVRKKSGRWPRCGNVQRVASQLRVCIRLADYQIKSHTVEGRSMLVYTGDGGQRHRPRLMDKARARHRKGEGSRACVCVCGDVHNKAAVWMRRWVQSARQYCGGNDVDGSVLHATSVFSWSTVTRPSC
ncbi:hypothetical protein WOLCODRAFT_146482 [Wolfiporia cocos MD-104 SS10]|uniref:Secreted protein n=1 Tax=Wolfiporia cocos (strain MD-104) TaxID=742152 RepID=A0A2H3JAW6_WOLCO|nr:hypothetical protein WOLCODRAFT_146482 [Wolfiporia cocos MD-104 SS10]